MARHYVNNLYNNRSNAHSTMYHGKQFAIVGLPSHLLTALVHVQRASAMHCGIHGERTRVRRKKRKGGEYRGLQQVYQLEIHGKKMQKKKSYNSTPS